ncbi:MAG: glycosyltransferase 87 family protein [Mycobacteriales bacterium]
MPATRRPAQRWSQRLPVVGCLVLLTLGSAVAGYAQKRPCLQNSWENSFQYTHHCYSDIYPLYQAEKLNIGAVPYVDHPVEYPVLIGGTMHLAASAARSFPTAERPVAYYNITALILGACLLLVLASTALLAGPRRWDVVLVAVSPVVIVYSFYNWDLLAMAFAGLGLEAWRRRRPEVAGVLLGLGAASKLYPAFLLVALLPLCFRADRLRAWAVAAGSGAAAWTAVNLPIYLAAPDGWLRFYQLSKERGPEIDTVWYQISYLTAGWREGAGKAVHEVVAPPQPGEAPALLNLLTLLGLAALWLLIYFIVLRAPVRPRVPQVAYLIVVSFLLVNKVWSPQFSIWYVPLVVLALPRRILFAWLQTAELLVFVGVLGYLASWNDRAIGVTAGTFFSAVWLRNGILLLISAIIVRDMYRPANDVVRRDGVDDPAGGVLDGAPEGPLSQRFLPGFLQPRPLAPPDSV